MISAFYEFIVAVSEICTKISFMLFDNLDLVLANINSLSTVFIVFGFAFYFI